MRIGYHEVEKLIIEMIIEFQVIEYPLLEIIATNTTTTAMRNKVFSIK